MATQAIDYKVILNGLHRIDFEVDYQDYMHTLDLLMEKGDSISEKEARLLGVIDVLVQDYETRRFKVGRSVTPRSSSMCLSRLSSKGRVSSSRF